METLAQDLKYGIRMLVKSPGFTAVAVLTLALGIGANTAIFSVINAALLRPLPYASAGQLVSLEERAQTPHYSGSLSVSYLDFLDWQKQNDVFENVAAFRSEGMILTGAGQPERLAGRAVSASFFSTLGARPLLGRDFLPDEDRQGGNAVVILSYSLWQQRLGSDPAIVGKTLTLGGEGFTVIGVLPSTFRFYLASEVFTPLGREAKEFTDRGTHPGIYAIGRMKPGVTFTRARAEMDALAQRLARAYPQTNSGVGITATPLREDLAGGVRTLLMVLLGAVGCVLLIACVNVASLMFARSNARRREMAIRAALGAGRLRVLRQLLTESVLLAVLGGGLGILLAGWGTALISALLPAGLTRITNIGVDGSVLAFTLAVSVLAGVALGLAPALQGMHTDVNEALKEVGALAAPSSGRPRFRNALIVAEVALGLMLMISAGLMIRSFDRLLRVDPGFTTEHILTMKINIPDTKYATPASVDGFYQQVVERVRALPGVQAAGAVTPLPLTGEGWEDGFSIEGQPMPAPGQFPSAEYHTITGDYLQALGIPLLEGRYFTNSDDATAPGVVLVSQSFAKRFWPGADAVGKRIKLGTPHHPGPLVTVVGVVMDTKQFGLDTKTRDEYYVAFRQHPLENMTLVLRSAVEPTALAEAVRREVVAVDPDQPVFSVKTMDQLLGESVASQRTSMLLLASFGALALILAAVGIYGVMSYAVSQRTREMGIRMALGARPADMFRLIAVHGMRLTLLGVGLGLAGAAMLSRVVASILFGISATDAFTYVAVSLLLAAVALGACLIPAYRAMQVDPLVALRYE